MTTTQEITSTKKKEQATQVLQIIQVANPIRIMFYTFFGSPLCELMPINFNFNSSLILILG